MRKPLIASALCLLVTAPSVYAGLQDDMNARWRGAWLIVNGELSSNCNGTATNNRAFSDLISGEGRRRFEAGEMARVTKVDVKRRRVDIFLNLNEPVLFEYRDGPFTLYNEAACEVEIMLELDDEKSNDLGVEGIEVRFSRWFERYTQQIDAELSPTWNERERRDYPADYEQTLAEYRVWKIDQHNELVDQKIVESAVEIVRLFGAVIADDQFGGGLSHGIAAMRENMESATCDRLVPSSVSTWGESVEAPNTIWGQGYETGQQLAYYMELGRLLPGCFIAPEDPNAFSELLTIR